VSDTWIGSSIGNGRYSISEKLGEGGMGSVYRAWDSNLKTDVVVKVPHATRQQDPEVTARFVREASSLVKLSHPHIVKIIDFGEQEGQPYAVMQFLSGGSLAPRQEDLGGGERLRCQPPDSLKDWLPSVAKALDFVHGQGYLHRDVKPANILFDAHGNAFLSDFGITKFTVAEQKANSGKSLTGAGMVVGTPEYMAPEVILGQTADGRLDQYGLAVTVFELLAGRRPFEDATATAVLVQHTTSPPPDVRSFNADIPPSLSTVIGQALAKNPADRFPSCSAFADAVLDALSGKSQVAKLKCPACQKSLKLEWKVRGRTLSCPACGSELKVSEDLTELTLPAGSGAVRDARGGTRAVVVGDAMRTRRSEPASERKSERNSPAPDRSEDFWEVGAAALSVPNSDPTVPISASEIGTRRSRVAKPGPQGTSKPSQPVRGTGVRKQIVIVASALTLLLLMLATVIYLLKRSTKDAAGGNPVAAAAPLEQRPRSPVAMAPEVVATNSANKPRESDLKDAPAVYTIAIEPPTARLSINGGSASISGFEAARQVVVRNPSQDASITLIASADGFRELRRELTPRPGVAETLMLKLEPMPGRTGGFGTPQISPGGASGSTEQPQIGRVSLPGSSGPQAAGAGEWKLVSTIGTGGADIYSIALSYDGALVASGGADRLLQLWDVRTGNLKGRIDRMSEVGSVAFLKDGKRLICSVGRRRSVEIWKESALSAKRSPEGRSGRSKSNTHQSAKPALEFTNDPNRELWRAVLSNDEKLLATAGNSGIVTLWDMGSARPLRQVQHGLVKFDQPSPTAARPGRGSSRRFGSPRTIAPAPSSQPGFAILGLAFSPNGKQLACGGESGVIALCSVSNGEQPVHLEGHTSGILQLAYSRDGRRLASVARDGTLRLWEVDQRKEWRSFNVGVGEAVAFSPDGRWIAAVGEDNTVRIWNVENQSESSVVPGHGSPITQIVFSNRGTRLATAAKDGTITIWDANFQKSAQPEPTTESVSAITAEPKAKPSQRPPEGLGAFAGTQPGQARTDNGLNLSLVWIPPGDFRMGSEAGPDHSKNEGPVDVKLTRGFWLAKFELTQMQWQRVMQTSPWKELSDDLHVMNGDNFPATHVTWENAMAFCRKLTEDEHSAGRLPSDWEYTLPTEAQWEYACRAGTTTPYYCGKTLSNLLESAWFKDNLKKDDEKNAQVVGAKAPNPWGLYDMHGNVAEWCRDWYLPDPPGGTDPERSSGSGTRVVRGGNWRSSAVNIRSAYRTGGNLGMRSSTVGFRVAVVALNK